MKNILANINPKRYALYLIRWQLSTPLLAPIVAYFKESESLFGTSADWIAAAVANFIGGIIFYWVDRFIFLSNKLSSQWEVQEQIMCADCNKTARGYRLVQTKNYDKTNDPNPKFRCEVCSIEKTTLLRNKGVSI